MKSITPFIRDFISNRLTKEQFHRRGQFACRFLAEQLGLAKGQYDIRSNPGGPAVWGEVTLHTNSLYLQFGDKRFLPVLVRSCNGRKDYSGNTNMYIPLGDFTDKFQDVLLMLKLIAGLIKVGDMVEIDGKRERVVTTGLTLHLDTSFITLESHKTISVISDSRGLIMLERRN